VDGPPILILTAQESGCAGETGDAIADCSETTGLSDNDH
jgi:hypothetical protein